MPTFIYTAKDNSGKEKTGLIDAPAEKAALKILSDQGLTVLSLTLEEGRLTFQNIMMKLSRVSLSAIVEFTRQLATMVNAGLPLIQSLEVLETQTKGERMKRIIADLISDIRGGKSFSASLKRHEDVFPRVYIALSEAGEASGTLDKTLLRLADNMEKTRDFQAKTKGAMVYPAIISLAMIGVFGIMVVFVLPKLSTMYDSLGADLPFITRALMGLSDFVTKRWYLLILIVAGSVFGFKKFSKTTFGKYFLARIIFKMPIFGNLAKQTQLTEFTRTLGLLIASGVPILDALQIGSNSLTNVIFRDGIDEALERVRKGEPLSAPFSQNKNFPPLISRMISVGEQTGKVDEVLIKLSTFYEAESERAIKNLSTAIEPIIMIVLGGMVGLLMLSVIMPIYNLTSQF